MEFYLVYAETVLKGVDQSGEVGAILDSKEYVAFPAHMRRDREGL